MQRGAGIWGVILAGVVALAIGLPARAATLNASDVPGGFSTSYLNPTVIGAGITQINASTTGAPIVLEFNALPAGAQTLSFTFSIPSSVGVQGPSNGWTYANAGGTLYYKTGTPFLYSAYEGAQLSYAMNNTSLTSFTDTVTLALGSSFAGPLYISLPASWGAPVSLSLAAPSNAIAAPAPVPLPPGAALLGSVLLALGLAAARRRKYGKDLVFS
jgi:hypothetical protein